MPHDGWHDEDKGHQHARRRETPTRRFVLAAAALLPLGSANAQATEASDRIAAAAIRLLASLDEGQRRQTLIAFPSSNRLDWHYIPRSRSGLALGAMRPEQAQAARALFASVLDEYGLRLLDEIRLLEEVLRERQGSFRDPDRYYVTIFGAPGSFPWGWRFEGHHLSLNVTLAELTRIAVTPFFMGAHPATVRDGSHKGLRPLGPAEDMARAIMASLDERQRRSAIIADRAFGDIVAGPARERDLGAPRGIEVALLGNPARTLVEALIDRFVGALAPDLREAQKRRVMEQELARFRFAWAGTLAPGAGHYFRIQGPATLIEHDNTQNDANHIHSVWRDLAADFGQDALAAHYGRDPHK